MLVNLTWAINSSKLLYRLSDYFFFNLLQNKIIKKKKKILKAQILNFFLRAVRPQTPLEAHACIDHGHGLQQCQAHAGPKTTFFKLTELESLKLAFLECNFKVAGNSTFQDLEFDGS